MYFTDGVDTYHSAHGEVLQLTGDLTWEPIKATLSMLASRLSNLRELNVTDLPKGTPTPTVKVPPKSDLAQVLGL